MPYIKTAKDNEGAIAEAIGTELTYLAGIPHPAYDKPQISTEGKSVTLPELNIRANLSDYLFEGSISNKGKKFLESLGKVIAFNWYVGQGDLNITNISVSGRWSLTCYPYDFDCSFKDLQSESSFAKSRMKDVSYETVDMDQQSSVDEIVNAALTTLRNSAAVSGVDCSDFDKLFDENNMETIKKGFYEQIVSISNIELEKIERTIEKHLNEESQKTLYKKYLNNKKEQSEKIILNAVLKILEVSNVSLTKNQVRLLKTSKALQHSIIEFNNKCNQFNFNDEKKSALNTYKKETLELALQGSADEFEQKYGAIEKKAVAAIDDSTFTKVARTLGNLILTALATASIVGFIVMAATSQKRGGFLFFHSAERLLSNSSLVFKDNIFPLRQYPGKIISKISPPIIVHDEMSLFNQYRFRIVEVEGKRLSFYQSSDLASGHAGDWFPCGELNAFSSDGDDPISKLTGQHVYRHSQMNYHYGAPLMTAIAEELKEIDKQQAEKSITVAQEKFNLYVKNECYPGLTRGGYDGLQPEIEQLTTEWSENNQGDERQSELFENVNSVLKQFINFAQQNLTEEPLGNYAQGWYYPDKDQLLEDIQEIEDYMRNIKTPNSPNAIEIAAVKRSLANFEHCLDAYLYDGPKNQGAGAKKPIETKSECKQLKTLLHAQIELLETAFQNSKEQVLLSPNKLS